MSTQTLQLNMEKLNQRKGLVLDMKKNKGLEGQVAQVVLALDYSFSMDSLYSSGAVQELVERVLPLGLAFDDNGEVDFYLFESRYNKMKKNLTVDNTAGYINREIIGKYSMGGTNYAPVINAIVQDVGGEVNGAPAKKGGFFSGLLGKAKPDSETVAFKHPVYVLYITDGANGDQRETEEAMRNASKYGIFFQFVGIGGASFPFLEKLDDLSGRVIDNANFFKAPNLSSTTDEQLYSLLLAEFPSWIPQAKAKNMLL